MQGEGAGSNNIIHVFNKRKKDTSLKGKYHELFDLFC